MQSDRSRVTGKCLHSAPATLARAIRSFTPAGAAGGLRHGVKVGSRESQILAGGVTRLPQRAP